MNGGWWLMAVCLAGLVALVGRGGSRERARWRAITEQHRAADTARSAAGGRSRRRAARTRPHWRSSLGAISSTVVSSPRRSILLAAVVAAVLGAVLGGPVAAMAAAAYGALATRAGLRHRSRERMKRDRLRRLDGLSALAADLRAGLSVPAAMAATVPPAPVPVRGTADRISELTSAAARLAEQTGAPLAELVERIEADARTIDRGLATAAAQAAGARATAWLLAGLPIGGIALGYAIGTDPLAVLLHTPLGAACAMGAIALQFAGLTWADRLSHIRAWSA